MAIISDSVLRERIAVMLPNQTPYKKTESLKWENIQNFNSLMRKGLENSRLECRLLLYETLAGEKVYIQYPGIESLRKEKNYPYDFKPILQKADGSYLNDMDFNKIWDIIDTLGRNHLSDIDILATIFVRMAFMLEYHRYQKECRIETVDIAANRVVQSDKIKFTWNALYLDVDVIETLNDRFKIEEISLEGFLYYNDLLAQNEDCKYKYLKGDKWNIKMGRINNCLSHLTVISYIRKCSSISNLISRFKRGVGPLPQSRFHEACGELVCIEPKKK